MSELGSIGNLLKKDVISQIKIEKNKVIQKVASEPNFNPIQYISSISISPLPENVKVELQEWCSHAESFLLYENVGLLESNFEFFDIERFIVQKINKKFYLINDIKGLMEELECNQVLPVKKLVHKDSHYLELSNEYKSIIAKKKPCNKGLSDHLEKLKIERTNLIKLLFGTDKDLVLLSNQLLEKGCMININDSERAITIDQKDEKLLNDILKNLASQYKVEFDNK